MNFHNFYKTTLSHFGFKKYFKNTVWILFGKFGTLAISFLATLYIARELGPGNFGELSYAVSFIALFSFIASFGIDSVLYRELIKFPEKRNSLLGTALFIKICASVCAVIATIVTAIFLSPKDVSLILIIILAASFLFQSFNIITAEFGAIVKNKGISILSILVALILNCGKVAVIYFGGGVIYLALILLSESVFYALGFIYLHTRTFGSLNKLRVDKKIISYLCINAWPFILSSACAVVYARIDQVMLKNIIDAFSVGLYDSAVRISELWYFIPTVLAGSLFPAIVLAKTHSVSSYKKRATALFGLVLFISLSITITVYLLASPIVLTIFGIDFIGAIPILKIYIWAFIPVSLIVVANQILLAENARVILFVSAVAGMVCNVCGNIVLIPQYQATGAAVATVLSSCMVACLLGCIYIYNRIMA